MKSKSLSQVLLLVLAVSAFPAAAIDSVFTYQGHLTDQGEPAQGDYDLRFTLQDTAGAPIGAPILLDDVAVAAGVFTVALDFGEAAFDGSPRFLSIALRRGAQTGGFTELAPRSAVTATPYAQVSENAGFAATVADGAVGTAHLADGAVTSPKLVAGSVGSAQIDANQVQRRVTGVCAAPQAIGQIASNGTVTCVTPAATGWNLSGNAGTNPATQFLGTTDNQPLELRSNNRRVARFEVFSSDRANVLLGSSINSITAGAAGATISGGGQNASINRVTDSNGTVGGGDNNQAGDGAGTTNDRYGATVSGGSNNIASGTLSTIGGGISNTASGQTSTVGGGSNNIANGYLSAIAGGGANRAPGAESAIGGGRDNTALGLASTVGGGRVNCAGGNFSWAGGLVAKVRPAAGTGTDPDGFGCDNVENADGATGDAGTFVWSDTGNVPFVSNGTDRFLVRVQNGMTVQRRLGIKARSPRAYFNVVRGDSGLPLPASPPATALGVFENDDGGDLYILAGGTNNKGLRFGDAENASTGGIVYTPTHNMQFRTNGNVARMTLGSDGRLHLSALGTAGSATLCRNASGQVSSCSSSARYKQNIADLGLGLDAVLRLRPVRYEWKESAMADVGFVAEEIAALDERLVTRNDTGEVEGVKYDRLTAVLAGAVQELAAQGSLERDAIATLRTQNATLRADVDVLRGELAALRALLVDRRGR